MCAKSLRRESTFFQNNTWVVNIRSRWRVGGLIWCHITRSSVRIFREEILHFLKLKLWAEIRGDDLRQTKHFLASCSKKLDSFSSANNLFVVIKRSNLFRVRKYMTSRTQGGGIQGFCDDKSKALVMKRVTMGGGEVKIVQICVTSLMDDPSWKSRKNSEWNWDLR